MSVETPQEREARIARMEQARERRKADQGSVWPTPDDAGTGVVPLEVGPGRGDLYRSSGFIPTFPTALSLVGNRAVSFARLFMSQPWVAAAVMRMLTWSVRVPMRCYRRTGADNDRQVLGPDDHPVAGWIHRPWTGGSQAQLVMSILGPLLVHGNGLNELDDSGSSLTSEGKDWRFVMPLMPWRGSLVGWKVDVDTPAFAHEVSSDKTLHVAWWSPTGPIGVSPLQQLGITLQIEDALQRYQRASMANGARPPSAVVASEAFLGIDAPERRKIMAQLRADITDLYAGPDNSGRPALLPPGLDWKPVGMSTVEAALIDQRKITREEVAAVYMLAPPILGIMDKANYSNMQSVKEMTYTDSLGPPMVLLEQCINAQICRDLYQDPDVFVEFDFSVVLRGDPLAQIAAVRDAIGSALMTPNEGRDVLHRPASDQDGMNEFYLPTNNLSPVGTKPQPVAPQFGGDGEGGDNAPGQDGGSGGEGGDSPGPTDTSNEPGANPGRPVVPPQRPKVPARTLHVVSGGREYELVPD